MSDWWNNSYAMRHPLKIVPDNSIDILAGYPIFLKLDYSVMIANNKVRPDFTDLEIVYLESDDETWTPLPKQIILDEDNLIVNFAARDNIVSTTTRYYLYMTNPTLVNAPVLTPYVVNAYVVDTDDTGGLGMSFTRPLSDWDGGLSLVNGAKAAFSMYGINARVVAEKGPDRGILEVKLDSDPVLYIDTYSSTYTDAVVYTSPELSVGQHYIRFRASGSKGPSSAGTAVKIEKIQYSEFTEAVSLGEEISTTLNPIRIVVGP